MPLYKTNAFLISPEIFDVRAKIELFNDCCWYIRNGMGKLTIEDKYLVLVLNCGIHWLKGEKADFRRKLINEACAQFILTYILRSVFNDYKGIKIIWQNEEANKEIEVEYKWSSPLFSRLLELQVAGSFN